MTRHKKLFLVVNPDRITFHPPTFIHERRESAIAEAERLARENPGQLFHVCESVLAKRKVDIETVEFDVEQETADVQF